MSEQEKRVIADSEGNVSNLLGKAISRRKFLKGGIFSAAGVAGMTLFGALGAYAATEGKVPLLVKSKGVILAEPSRCVGCRRCELACTEFKEGKSHPFIARIKIYRNLNFGPKGVQYGYWRKEGKYGNSRIIQETCKQCAHPVPCAMSCPNGAIEADPVTGAREINSSKCVGCGICTRACPWEMTAVDPETKKATKCNLCDGNPMCVDACPSGALKYISWRDLTKEVAVRQASIAAVNDSCNQCHATK
ncbi:4Fe-4S dicluster domain-containing protein [Zhaonella formicivorans]|uniref:4Fe-4S dicluster domain-containing protein n=1 Tax=Zhaonella formicivorans TaxID=2528593 RepID=UPI0010D958A4|nr:4Fe-4S dicluster domain-containing protein [Zhaonella formicivorans]